MRKKPDKPKIRPLYFVGLTTELFPYTVESIEQNAPDEPGVYAFWTLWLTGLQWTPVSIRQSIMNSMNVPVIDVDVPKWFNFQVTKAEQADVRWSELMQFCRQKLNRTVRWPPDRTQYREIAEKERAEFFAKNPGLEFPGWDIDRMEVEIDGVHYSKEMWTNEAEGRRMIFMMEIGIPSFSMTMPELWFRDDDGNWVQHESDEDPDPPKKRF